MTIRVAAIEVSHWHALYDAAYLRHLVAMPDVELVAIQDSDASLVARRAAVAGRQRDDLPSSTEQEWIGTFDERFDSSLDERLESAVDFRFGAGMENMKLAAELFHRFLELRGLESNFGVVWIEQQSDDASVGNELKQKLQLLRYKIGSEPADAGNVSTRLVEAPDDTCLDWIAAERSGSSRSPLWR